MDAGSHAAVSSTTLHPLLRIESRHSESDELSISSVAGRWAVLDAAFLENHDPLTSRGAEDAYRPLFAR